MRPLAATLALAVAAIGIGCGGTGRAELTTKGEAGPRGGPSEVVPSDRDSDEAVIRGWNDAVNSGDYDRAAAYFARDALVVQVAPIRLETRADAEAFNEGLPCRADITDIESDDDSTLAAFELREGRTGECEEGGAARVRFVIADGQIEQWRQLPAGSEPQGDPA